MTTIKASFGWGGSGLNSDLAEVLRDIADDQNTLKAAINAGLTGVSITSPDPAAVSASALAAFTAPPTAPEMANVRTLVNELRTTVIAERVLALELKTDMNTLAPSAITSPDPAAVSGAALAAFTDPPSAPEMALLRTLANELRTTTIATRTLMLEVKAKAVASFDPVGTLKTIKG